MADPLPFRAIPTRDQAAVVMVRGPWRHRIAASDLPAWINLYRGLRDRDGGRFARFYTQPIEALETTAKALGISLPKPLAKPQIGAKK